MRLENENFAQDGYVIVKDLLSEVEVRSALGEIETVFRLAASFEGDEQTLGQLYEYLSKKYPEQKKKAYDLLKTTSMLQRIAVKDELLTLVQKLLRSEVISIDLPQYRFDTGSNDRLLPMHQELFGQLSWNMCTLWLPLSKVNAERGTIRLIPDSHRDGLLNHGMIETPFGASHGVTEDLPNDSVSLDLDPGDAVIFSGTLVHGSVPSQSDDLRTVAVIRYNDLRNAAAWEEKNSGIRIPQE